MSIFLIDFSKELKLINHVKNISENTIEYECADGGAAYKKVAVLMPEKIIIYYGEKAVHARRTAIAIKERKLTSQIPIYVVGGSEMENQKIKDIGYSIYWEKLSTIL